MEHHFNTDLACEYSVIEAIFINHFQFWIIKNYANGLNFFDDHTWTYNSVAGLKEIFPYLSEKQIRNTLDKLVDNGVLIKGNYNDKSFDRTLWYAFADEGKWIFQKGQMHLTKRANGIAQEGKPIPYNNKDNDTDTTPYISPKGDESEVEVLDEDENAFENAWQAYGRKGSKKLSLRRWKKLSAAQKKEIIDKIPQYVSATPDRVYRKDFEGWINPANELWKREIVVKGQTDVYSREREQRENEIAAFTMDFLGPK